ncbi:hypothetical protein ACJX0J_025753, partial [Zea mays]
MDAQYFDQMAPWNKQRGGRSISLSIEELPLLKQILYTNSDLVKSKITPSVPIYNLATWLLSRPKLINYMLNLIILIIHYILCIFIKKIIILMHPIDEITGQKIAMFRSKIAL